MTQFFGLELGNRRRQRGATALEYALVLAFVAVAVLGALQLLSGDLSNAITKVGGTVNEAAKNDFKAP